MSTRAVILGVLFAVVLPVAQFLPPPTEVVPPVVVTHLPPNPSAPAAIEAQAVRISQVFGGGAVAPAYPCDFVELFNATGQPVSLAGWSVQYAAAIAGARWFSTPLGNLTIAGYGYFHVLEACNGTPPAVYDVKGSIAMNSTEGKVALVSGTAQITGVNDPAVVDFVGYGDNASEYEGSKGTPTLTSKESARRGEEGCNDTDDNRADFALSGSVAPRNTKSQPHPCPEAGPVVWSTSPKRGATGVARNAVIKVDFSEPVTLGPDWFEIRCDLSGPRGPGSAAVSGELASYTIDPTADFFADEACHMTISAAGVRDADAIDPPDGMTADYMFDFRTVAGQCGDPAYPVHGIQGAGPSSPAAGQLRTVEGVVTGDFQGANGLSGYFLQEEDADADGDAQTSEGIFVDERTGTPAEVAAGSRVRVTGTAGEVDGMTALSGVSRTLTCAPVEPPEPLEITLPLASAEEWEQYEGMLVRFGDALTVADSAELASDGRLTLTRGGVPFEYTQANVPDVEGYAAWEREADLQSIILDDGSQVKQPDPIRFPPPELSASNTVRAGDEVNAGLTGIVDGRGGPGVIQPVGEVVIAPQNPRTAAPARTAGNVRIAFLSLNDYFNVSSGTGGPRGASSAAEFARQRDKLIQALTGLDADVIAVSKLENDGFAADSALADLVAGLNATATPGTFAFVDPGTAGWGSDTVRVAIVYRVSSLAPVGLPAMLDQGAFDQAPAPPVHRAPMAQTFEEATWGERFTLVVNEWHDRGSCPVSGTDADAADGQGCWNAARTAAAQDLQAWLDTDPTGSGDPDVLVVGELNALAQDEPVRLLTGEGYVDVVDDFVGPAAITALSAGRAGYTGHALASPPLAPQVAGAAVWSINAEEPSALDYQLENKSAAQQSSLYAADAFRSSDQNPFVVDLQLLPDQGDLGGSYGTAWHTGQGVWRLGAAWGGEDDGVARGGESWNDGQGELVVSVDGPAAQFACLYGWLDFGGGAEGVADGPDSDWDEDENVLTGLMLAPGPDQLVTFPLPAGAAGSNTLHMRVRLIPAPDPATAACDASPLAPAAGPGPTGRADGGEVEDYTFDPVPLAVDVSSFVSRSEARRILLTWETTGEQNLAGFDLQRGPKPDGPWERVNETPIPAANPGAGTGTSYEYADAGPAEGVVWHRLVGIDLTGRRAELGRVETRVLAPNALGLTELAASPAETPGAIGFAGIIGCAALAALARRRSLKPAKP